MRRKNNISVGTVQAARLIGKIERDSEMFRISKPLIGQYIVMAAQWRIVI
jgi:hypothetical protein